MKNGKWHKRKAEEEQGKKGQGESRDQNFGPEKVDGIEFCD